MKKCLLIFLCLGICLSLISWGVTGHRTIGQIAENHLTPKAKAAVQQLLGNETLADVSTWADEVRNDPEHKETASWHFLNLPLGLSYQQFEQKVLSLEQANVYSALSKAEQELLNPETPRPKKVEYLKFIVHLVGDLHQPMHISRAEDKGGNTIQLNYEGKGTNLHSLWDSRLLEKQGLTYEQLAEKYDHVSTAQIRQWQKDPLMKWIWESYEVSGKLYQEVDGLNNRSIGEDYYNKHIDIIGQRIEQGGVRLAGVLNEIFKGGPVNGEMIPPPGVAEVVSAAPIVITAKTAAAHLGENVKVCDRIYGSKDLGSMTLVNVGAEYPNQLLTVVLRGQAKKAITEIKNTDVCVTGKLIDYNGKPEIIVTEASQLEFK